MSVSPQSSSRPGVGNHNLAGVRDGRLTGVRGGRLTGVRGADDDRRIGKHGRDRCVAAGARVFLMVVALFPAISAFAALSPPGFAAAALLSIAEEAAGVTQSTMKSLRIAALAVLVSPVASPVAAFAGDACPPIAVVRGTGKVVQELSSALVGRGIRVEPAGLPGGQCAQAGLDLSLRLFGDLHLAAGAVASTSPQFRRGFGLDEHLSVARAQVGLVWGSP